MKKHEVLFLPEGRVVEAEEGSTLKDVIIKAGLSFDFPCGGRGKCGKCKVRVKGKTVPGIAEETLLSPEEIKDGIRLACHIILDENLEIELLNSKDMHHQILIDSLARTTYAEPAIVKSYLEVEKPSLQDMRTDWQRLRDSLRQKGHGITEVFLPVLRQIPGMLRDNGYRITAVTHNDELRGIEGGDTTGTLYGVAFDIGTTTIVGYLVDLCSGMEVNVVSTLNPQTKYGGDVISRITHAGKSEEGLADLHNAVTAALNDLIGEAAAKAGIGRRDIYAVAVAGNTAMHHLFLGINPHQLALAPYVPVTGDPVIVEPGDVRLDISPAGRVFVLPNIAGFVGADTVAVLLATEMDESAKNKLVIDIGTNGEIVVGSRDRLVACSAAAGPAFEGAQISCGMRGATGAIDHVTMSEQFAFTVIGGGVPLGICGSALLDAVAGLLETGLINKSGKFIEPEKITNPAGVNLRDRVIKHNGSWAFLLAGDVLVTQKDIRELQLAKAAIAAGIKILMKTCGITTEEISEVLLAGAFGNYLNPRSACIIGLIPGEMEQRIRMIGNAAGSGAKLALLSAGEYNRASRIAKSVEFVELGSDPEFNSIFVSSMLFP